MSVRQKRDRGRLAHSIPLVDKYGTTEDRAFQINTLKIRPL
jgi:hypothetical protein